MLFKKDVEEIKRVIVKFEDKLELISSELGSLKEMQSLFSRELAAQREFVEKNMDKGSGVDQGLLSLDLIHEEFEKAVRRFDDLQRRLEDYVFEQLGSVIRTSVGVISKDLDTFSNVKANVTSACSDLKDLRKDIEKFKTIASHVKTSDFAMQEYARELTRNDQEKLRLMKEIDNLQRLVASLRKKQRV